MRLVGSRNLLHWNGMRPAEDLAGACEMKYRDHVTFKSRRREVDVLVSYGSLPVTLPEHLETELRLVVVKWPRGERPMMLLTTLRAVRSRRSLRQVVEGCLTRWRIEETIRFVKRSYGLEDMRLLEYGRFRSLVAIVTAVAYFAMAWLGLGEKLGVLADHVKRVSRRMFEVPDFFFYAIADGVSELFTRCGRWQGFDGPDRDERSPGKSLQLELGL